MGTGIDLWDARYEELIAAWLPTWSPALCDQWYEFGLGTYGMFPAEYAVCRDVFSNPAIQAQMHTQVMPQSESSLLFLDGPEHMALRRMLASLLLSTEDVVARSTAFSSQLVQGWDDEVRIDMVSQFAEPIAVDVTHHLLGIEYGAIENLTDLLRGMGTHFKPMATPAERQIGEESSLALIFALRGILRSKDYLPGGALDRLTQARAANQLSMRELLSLMMLVAHGSFENSANLLCFAGVETMTNLELHSIMRQGTEAEQRRGVEELLRLGSAVRIVGRRTREATRIGNVEVPADQMIMPFVHHANRDPAMSACPAQVQMEGPRVPHLTFGSGPHTCLGAAMARGEIRGAMCALAKRYTTMEVMSTQWNTNPVMFGPTSFEVMLRAK